MLKLKSIRMRIIVAILPLTVVSMFILGFMGYKYAYSIIETEINQKTEYKMKETIQSIEKQLSNHAKIVESISKTTGVLQNNISKDQYADFLKNLPLLNNDTLGCGIWLEPYKYSPDTKYFGPYAYKDNGNIVTTFDYEAEDYDYPNQDWYKIGKTVKSASVWTEPYYDELTKITMITTNSPIYDQNSNFYGVATADMDLGSIQNIVSSIKFGENGRAMLLSKDGLILADIDKDKVMKQNIAEDNNKSLGELGKTIIQNINGTGKFDAENGVNRAYYSKIEQTEWILVVMIPETDLFAPLKSLQRNTIITILISILGVLFIILIFSKNIKNQISRVNDFSLIMANGDFSNNIAVETDDELGAMSKNLNAMTKSLDSLIIKVKKSLDEVVDTSRKLSESSNQTHLAAEQIALSIQDISTGNEKQYELTNNAKLAADDINLGMQNIGDNVMLVAEKSVEALNAANNGNNAIKNVISQMNDINQKVTASSKVIDVLGEKSDAIGQILMLITSISAQTNLLALNAAIEAARAGEAGRGFAVVADEVRKLAEQSGKATGQIGTLINEIQSGIESAVKTMKEGTSSLSEGMNKVNETEQSFIYISSFIEEISGKLQDVSATVEEICSQTQLMAEASDNINEISSDSVSNIESVAAATEEQCAIMKEVSDISSKLSEMALNLENDLRRFKTKEK